MCQFWSFYVKELVCEGSILGFSHRKLLCNPYISCATTLACDAAQKKVKYKFINIHNILSIKDFQLQ
jgi:hypothetical protein